MKSKGLGDSIEKFPKYTGIKSLNYLVINEHLAGVLLVEN